MQLNHTKLKGKGWSDEEIEEARNILLQAEENKHPRLVKLEKSLYWIVLGIIFLGGVGVSLLIEPLLYTSTPGQAIMFIALFGVLFGTLSSIMVKDIEALELHHHIIISASIPAAAIIASVFIAKRANVLAQLPEFIAGHHPILLGGIFALGAIIPYIILVLSQRKKYGA